MSLAVIQRQEAPLSSDFGMECLRFKFSSLQVDQILATVGTISRGPNKGKPRGTIAWNKVAAGGWGPLNSFDSMTKQGVLRPGTINWSIFLNGELLFIQEEMQAKEDHQRKVWKEEAFQDVIKDLDVTQLRILRDTLIKGSAERDQVCLQIQKLTITED